MIIAVDFDGTLHSGAFPHIGEPVTDAIEVMQKLHNDGHKLIVWTCRCEDKLLEAINWLAHNNIPFNRINDNDPDEVAKYGTNSRKINADLYVDDKQVRVLPTWSEIYEYVNHLAEIKRKEAE